MQKQKKPKRKPYIGIPRASVNIIIEGRPVWGNFSYFHQKPKKKEEPALLKHNKEKGGLNKPPKKHDKIIKPLPQKPGLQEKKISGKSSTGYVHAIVQRNPSGKIIKTEIYEVSGSEAFKHCRRLARGQACVIIRSYYTKPCKNKSGCFTSIPKLVEYWARDGRDRACTKFVSLAPNGELLCRDYFILKTGEMKLKIKAKELAQWLHHYIPDPKGLSKYNLIFNKLIEYTTSQMDRERKSHNPDNPEMLKRLEKILESGLKAMEKIADFIKKEIRPLVTPENYDEYKARGIVSNRCPTFTIVGSEKDKKKHKLEWCKKWICFSRGSTGIDAFIAEDRSWCSENIDELKDLKAPY